MTQCTVSLNSYLGRFNGDVKKVDGGISLDGNKVTVTHEKEP